MWQVECKTTALIVELEERFQVLKFPGANVYCR